MMRLLFAITVSCFIAVYWVALARRIRLAQRQFSRPVNRSGITHANQEFFEAEEFRTPRPLRLEQEILRQTPRRAVSEIFFASQIGTPNPVEVPRRIVIFDSVPAHRSPEPMPIRAAAPVATLFGQTLPIARIDSSLRSDGSGSPIPVARPSVFSQAPRLAPLEFTLHRKPVQSVRTSRSRRRVGLSRFNIEMGNLADPYTSPLRGLGTQGPVRTNTNDR